MLSDLNTDHYCGVFESAKYKAEIRIAKNQMAEQINVKVYVSPTSR
jgi:hypothetical protein